jgi:hypothetical protein
MDWAQFLQDNSQSLFTLFGVFLGSVLTYLISWTNTRTEAKEKDKDREANLRQAQAELAVELAKSDFKIIEDSLDQALRSMEILLSLSRRCHLGEITRTEFDAEIKALPKSDKKFVQAGDTDMVAQMLASSMGFEFYSKYQHFWLMLSTHSMRLQSSPSSITEVDPYGSLVNEAGELHDILVKRLVAIRAAGYSEQELRNRLHLPPR